MHMIEYHAICEAAERSLQWLGQMVDYKHGIQLIPSLKKKMNIRDIFPKY